MIWPNFRKIRLIPVSQDYIALSFIRNWKAAALYFYQRELFCSGLMQMQKIPESILQIPAIMYIALRCITAKMILNLSGNMKSYLFLILAWISFGKLAAQSASNNGFGYLGFNHLALQVKDMEASKDFYTNVVGLKPISVPDSLKAIRGWFDTGNGQQLHLLAGRTTPVVNDKNGGHFAIFVSSIEAAEKFLSARKASFHKQVRFDGVVQIYFADPDGYLIEVNQKK